MQDRSVRKEEIQFEVTVTMTKWSVEYSFTLFNHLIQSRTERSPLDHGQQFGGEQSAVILTYVPGQLYADDTIPLKYHVPASRQYVRESLRTAQLLQVSICSVWVGIVPYPMLFSQVFVMQQGGCSVPAQVV